MSPEPLHEWDSGSGPRLVPSVDALEGLGEFYRSEPNEDGVNVWDELSVRRYWLSMWRAAVDNDYDVAILIDGPSGRGKSALALSIGMELDPTLTPSTLSDHVAFTATEFLDCIERAKAGQVVIYDEAVRGLLSSDTFAAEQKAIVTAFAIIRAKNLIMLLLVPEVWQIAKSFRSRRAGWFIHVEDRGISWVHVRDDRIRYKQDDSSLGLYKDNVHGPLTWDSLDGTRLWIAYLKIKMARINEYLSAAKDELLKRRKRKERSPPADEQADRMGEE